MADYPIARLKFHEQRRFGKIDGELRYAEKGEVKEMPLAPLIERHIENDPAVEVVEVLDDEGGEDDGDDEETPDESFKERLTEVNQVGESRAETIVELYPTEDDLVAALEEDELDLNEQVEQNIRDAFVN